MLMKYLFFKNNRVFDIISIFLLVSTALLADHDPVPAGLPPGHGAAGQFGQVSHMWLEVGGWGAL